MASRMACLFSDRRFWTVLGVLLMLLAVTGCGQESAARLPHAALPTQAKVTVYGAAGQVSGSLSLLDTGTARCLVDCGAFYANAEETVPPAGTQPLCSAPRTSRPFS